MTEELTQKQIETLRAISSFMDDNGVPPTLKELGRILGVRSDQTVIDRLAHLEAKGYLVLSNQARGISLSEGALVFLGKAPSSRISVNSALGAKNKEPL